MTESQTSKDDLIERLKSAIELFTSPLGKPYEEMALNNLDIADIHEVLTDCLTALHNVPAKPNPPIDKYEELAKALEEEDLEELMDELVMCGSAADYSTSEEETNTNDLLIENTKNKIKSMLRKEPLND